MKFQIVTFNYDEDDFGLGIIVLDSMNRDYSESEQCDFDFVEEDVAAWLVINKIPEVGYNDLYRIKYNYPSWDVDVDEREYILTEKQSALFLLRFR